MNFTTGYILTKAGEALQAKAESGTELKLTKMQLGSGTAVIVDDYYERTALIEPKNAMSISEIKQVTTEKDLCVAIAVLTNAAVDTSYTASELGLFAQDTDGTEILYAVSYDSNPTYIASKDDGIDITMKFYMYIVSTSDINITLTLPKTAEEIATVAAGYAAKAAESEAKAKQLEATANNYLQTTQQAMTLANGYANISKAWAEGNASPDGVADTNSPTGYTQSAKIWAALSKEYAGLSKFKLPIGYYNSVDEMKASETAIVGRPCVTLGYYEPNDGGGAAYIIRQKKESDTDDGGSILVLANGNVAELIIDGAVNVKQFGAKGDGISDDVLPIQKCIDWACINKVNVHIPQGTYSISNALYIYQWQAIIGSGKTQTCIKRTTDSVDPKYGVSAVIILEKTDNYEAGYTEGQNISNMYISSDTLIDYGIYAGIACPFTNINNIIIDKVKNGIVYNAGTWLAEISYIEILSPEIGIKMNQGTSLHLKNTYVMTPSKTGYYTDGLVYSNWENIACDWATNDAICYKFSFSEININGLGSESDKAKKIIEMLNSNISIHAGFLHGLATDDKRPMITLNGSSLTLDTVNIGENLSTPIVNNICLKGETSARFYIKNCTISKYIKNVYDITTAWSNFIAWDNGNTMGYDDRYIIGDIGSSSPIRESFKLIGNVGGTPNKTLTGGDASWGNAPSIGDIFVNQNPKNGIAFFQAITDNSGYNMQGKITNIAGNVLTFDSLKLDNIANTRGIVISSTGTLDNVEITAVDTNKKEITVVDSSNFTVGESPVYRTNGTFIRDNDYMGVQQVLALSTTDRVINPIAGIVVFDTTLNKPIWYNGRNWVDANGNNV